MRWSKPPSISPTSRTSRSSTRSTAATSKGRRPRALPCRSRGCQKARRSRSTRSPPCDPRATLRRFGHETGAEAPGAYPDVLADAVHDDVDVLQVRALDALGLDVRVADVIGHPPLLAANCTLRCHGFLRKGVRLPPTDVVGK